MSTATGRRGARASSLDHALAPVMPVLLAVAAIACLAGFARVVAIAPLHVPLDPNEGWNAYHAVAAITGRGLYPDPAGFMINNYPPLSFYVTGCLGRLIGDDIVAGRIISLLSFLCVCAFVTLSARRMNCGWQQATFAALFLAAVMLATSDYVGMDDPQLFAHSLQLAGLLLVLREPRTPAATIAAAALFVAGEFVKHNVFALPLASLFWLALFERRDAVRLAMWTALFSISGLVASRIFLGVNLLDRLYSARVYSLAELGDTLVAWLPFAAIPLCALAGLAVLCRKDRMVILVAAYAAIAVSTGAVLLGGAGVDVNAMFDADIALALGVALALARLATRRNPLPHIGGRALALGCMLPLAVLAVEEGEWRDWSFWERPMHDEAARAVQDVSYLRAHAGPTLCEVPRVLLLGRKARGSGRIQPRSAVPLARTRSWSSTSPPRCPPFCRHRARRDETLSVARRGSGTPSRLPHRSP